MSEWIWLVGVGVALLAGIWLWASVRGAATADNAYNLSGEQGKSRLKINAAIYREQLAQLQQRHASGELDDEQFSIGQQQMDANLQADLLQPLPQWEHRPMGRWKALLIVTLPVVMTAGIFLVSDGNQHFRTLEVAEAPLRTVEDMVLGLQQRLVQEPDDLRGWAMLGRSLSVLERYSESAQAYGRANELSDSNNAELLVAEAEALGMSQEQRLTGKPQALLQAALVLNPHHIQALWYALIAASQSGAVEQKQQYLERLGAEPDLPPQLAELLRTEFGYVVAPQTTAAFGFDVQIAIAPELRNHLPADATLFVFAKAQNGPPMPLAVSRQSLPKEWPVKVRLDDDMSMMPGQTLSAYQAWTIVARISASGQAQGQTGDWQAQIELNAAPEQPVQLEIKQQIP